MALALKQGAASNRRLDFSRDYATTYGGPATTLEQDGIAYNMHGEPLDAMEVEEEPVPQEAAEDELKAMDGNALRALVESYGETWHGVEAAKKFLRGQR